MLDWNNFYKYKQGLAVANMLYQPLVHKDNTAFCMNWNANNYFVNESMTDDLYNFWFNKEVEYINKLKDKKYIPEIINIDTTTRQIKFKWYGKSLNAMIENNQIDSIPDWKNKIKTIKEDLEQQNIFKINMYPHTFYFDNNNEAHIMDLYGCTDTASRYLDIKYLKPLIRNNRFDKFIVNDQLDTHELYNETIKTNYAEWPGDFLNA